VLGAAGSGAAAEITRRLAQRESQLPPDPTADPAALIKEFSGAGLERREGILALLGASGAGGIWTFLGEQAAGSEPRVRLAALDALAVHGGGDPTAIIGACLNFPDEETRALAATLLGRRVIDTGVWSRAATDPSPVVRIAYLSAVEDAPDKVRLASARAALATGEPQLRTEAASVLGGARTKDAVELLIPLLDDPSSADVAADGLFYFFGRGFGSATEARAWWSQEARSYSDNLQISDE
jgi:HEAT repeat protein